MHAPTLHNSQHTHSASCPVRVILAAIILLYQIARCLQITQPTTAATSPKRTGTYPQGAAIKGERTFGRQILHFFLMFEESEEGKNDQMPKNKAKTRQRNVLQKKEKNKELHLAPITAKKKSDIMCSFPMESF